jgi:hypothetical protein
VLPRPAPIRNSRNSRVDTRSSSSVFTASAGGVGKETSSSKSGGEGFLLSSGVPVREGQPGSSGAGDSDDEAAPVLATASAAEIAAKAEAAKKAAAFKAANAPAIIPMDPNTVARPNVPRAAPTEAAGSSLAATIVTAEV